MDVKKLLSWESIVNGLLVINFACKGGRRIYPCSHCTSNSNYFIINLNYLMVSCAK